MVQTEIASSILGSNEDLKIEMGLFVNGSYLSNKNLGALCFFCCILA